MIIIKVIDIYSNLQYRSFIKSNSAKACKKGSILNDSASVIYNGLKVVLKYSAKYNNTLWHIDMTHYIIHANLLSTRGN